MGPNERTRWLPKKRLTRAQSEPLFVSDGEVTSLKKFDFCRSPDLSRHFVAHNDSFISFSSATAQGDLQVLSTVNCSTVWKRYVTYHTSLDWARFPLSPTLYSSTNGWVLREI